jgi:N-acetylneuraminate synthase
MKNIFRIGSHTVGINQPPLLIAEIGINHGGSIIEAKKLVKSASDAGIKIIKHQTHIVGDEMTSSAKSAIPGNSQNPIYKIMEDCALNYEDEKDLKKYTEDLGLTFLSTPFSRAAVDRLLDLNVSAFKIGSGECNNLPLVDYIASMGKPILMSTGMNDLNSVADSVAVLQKHSVPFALLHTTNLYPTPNKLVRLGAITDLANKFPNTPVGLSDHTVTNHSIYGAIALGASLIEKHYTDTHERIGPDIVCSMDKTQCEQLIAGISILYQQRHGMKSFLPEEQVTRDFAYSTVVTICDIKKGTVLGEDNIWVKRPGKKGIPASEYYKVIGKKIKINLKADSHIEWKDIALDV